MEYLYPNIQSMSTGIFDSIRLSLKRNPLQCAGKMDSNNKRKRAMAYTTQGFLVNPCISAVSQACLKSGRIIDTNDLYLSLIDEMKNSTRLVSCARYGRARLSFMGPY